MTECYNHILISLISSLSQRLVNLHVKYGSMKENLVLASSDHATFSL